MGRVGWGLEDGRFVEHIVMWAKGYKKGVDGVRVEAGVRV